MSFFNNVISKLQNKHFLSLVGNAIVAFFGILTTYCIFHYLSKSDAGKWFVFMSIISMADAVRNGFLSTATVKFYAGLAQEKGRQMLGSIWFLAIVLTLAASAIGAIC
ncbi:MAG: hypothetical protein EBX41_02885, partial [Chitinophagia bacterium]|nr:hypothetical protein [Chitinophagia bacterium]